MKVKVKKLKQNAQIPSQAKPGDFCYDVYATSCRKIAHRTYEYGIGLAFQIEREDVVFGKYGIPYKFIYETDPKTGKSIRTIETIPAYFGVQKSGYENVKLSIDFRPRSSIWKTGMILSNCEGTIDELYRGEVKAVFYHINPFKKKYKVGERIGQIKLGITLPLEFEQVSKLNLNTERGTGGFGSTGK